MFALLAIVSLTLKLLPVHGPSTPDVDEVQQIADTLTRTQFQIRMPEPATDPAWVSGVHGDCVVQVASVSPHGWHRDVVDWHAGADPLVYAFGGRLYDRQPLARTMMAYYLAKFGRYVGLSQPAVRVLAAIRSPACQEEAVRRVLLDPP